MFSPLSLLSDLHQVGSIRGFISVNLRSAVVPSNSANTTTNSDPRPHPASKKHLPSPRQNQQNTKRPRKSHNPPRLNDRLTLSNLYFLFLRRHRHLRMDQRGDPGRQQQNPHNRNPMKFHLRNSAPSIRRPAYPRHPRPAFHKRTWNHPRIIRPALV